MINSSALKRENEFIAPWEFWCENYQQTLRVDQCIARRKQIQELSPESKLLQELSLCIDCEQRGNKSKPAKKNGVTIKKMAEKPKEQKQDDKKFQVILDFKKNPVLLEQIQSEADNDFREPWGQIMYILRERFESEEKK